MLYLSSWWGGGGRRVFPGPLKSGRAESHPTLMFSLLPRAFHRSMTERPGEPSEHVCVTIKHAVTLECAHQKGALQRLIKMCVSLSKPLQTLFPPPTGKLVTANVILRILSALRPLDLYWDLSAPECAETKCPVWCPVLTITDAGSLLLQGVSPVSP